SATTAFYPLSLHDALPILGGIVAGAPEPVALLGVGGPREVRAAVLGGDGADGFGLLGDRRLAAVKLQEQGRRHRVVGLRVAVDRSEEHTSELQSRENLVCR